MAELIGMARGMIADGNLNDAEIAYLYKWLAATDGAHSDPMIGILVERLDAIFADGRVDEEERADLQDTLMRLTGSDFELGEALKSTSLPLCKPAPRVTIPDRRFCFTGTFTFGTRSACEMAIEDRGGETGGIGKATNYLVIGEYATDAWMHASYGRKIEQAVEWRSAGVPIRIISEQHWRKAL
ncbi:BRCT domain-containing protein [Fuscibacter oryzae]|uniref:BRCT domain-containing protein n=1 Tax=Fuscibacter oryzae TaxID=2803939 RepID=UPI002E28D165|nr:BRCT domain-containing protein [Fuscibacter oryzae]